MIHCFQFLGRVKWAPFAYLSLQLSLMGSCMMVSDYFIKFSVGTTVFWIDVILTLIFYFITHLRDPGYVTLANLQITDASQPMSYQNRNQDVRHKPTQSGFMMQNNISEFKQRPKSEEDHIELNAVNLPDEERLQNEPSSANSPKQIKSLNISDDEDKLGLKRGTPESPCTPELQMVCEISVIEDPGMQDSFSEAPREKSTHLSHNIQIQKTTINQTQTNGNNISEGSTKHTNQPTQITNLTKHISAESISDHPLQSPQSQLGNNPIQIQIRYDDDNQIFIERRYCNSCNQDQMIRSKHCKECRRCVACYDHHCPWMGNCIGEKNKCPFYWFIIFQLVQILIVCIQVLITIIWSKEYFSNHIYMLLVLVTIAFFLLMVSCLLFYHTYLAFINLTTWENVSWHKISYLKDLPEEKGSPFNNGFMINLRNFCRFRVPQITTWDYNQETIRNIKH